MTTHEMILLCPSLPGVRRCIPCLCLMSRFATFAAFWKIGLPPTNGLKHAAACCSTANFSGGPLVPGRHVTVPLCCLFPCAACSCFLPPLSSASGQNICGLGALEASAGSGHGRLAVSTSDPGNRGMLQSDHHPCTPCVNKRTAQMDRAGIAGHFETSKTKIRIKAKWSRGGGGGCHSYALHPLAGRGIGHMVCSSGRGVGLSDLAVLSMIAIDTLARTHTHTHSATPVINRHAATASPPAGALATGA